MALQVQEHGPIPLDLELEPTVLAVHKVVVQPLTKAQWQIYWPQSEGVRRLSMTLLATIEKHLESFVAPTVVQALARLKMRGKVGGGRN